ncbi:MAG: IS1634 family transposase [Chloroflexota bacterium]|nr:IS1634 family transposase [Chloroflexota bacterium]
MDTELTIITERVDDFVLLIQVMIRLGLPAILDQYIPRHWLQEGLSWGWVATIWLAHIISEGDHRKLTVRDWVAQAHTTLEETTGLEIRETDFTDDRLAIVLRELSKPEYWQAIERELSRNTIRVYDLSTERVRVDATTISGYHSGGADSLFQFGKSKDNPALRQVKQMVGALDPLGLPLATDVVSGERADDGLYIPIIDRIVETLEREGMLFVGDCKMSAWATRVHIRASQQHYLTPLALTGNTAQNMETWIENGLNGTRQLVQVYALGAQEGDDSIAEGYELTRPCIAQEGDQTLEWTERVLVVRSFAHAEAMKRGLEQRLTNATAKLEALTPHRGRGRRQIEEEQVLIEKADAILEHHRVEELLSYTFERQVEQQVKYIGRGRGAKDRPQEVVERVRYQITAIVRDEAAIDALQQTFGWRAYATDMPAEQLSLAEAILTYREEWRIEHGFHRLKSAPLSIAPLFVKRDDQVTGLVNLLTIAVRLLTLVEFVVRRGLQRENTQLVGLHKENPKKPTDRPTTERLLQAFSNITLTIIHFPDRVIRHVTPLTPLQEHILALLDLSPDIYRSLAKNSV